MNRNSEDVSFVQSVQRLPLDAKAKNVLITLWTFDLAGDCYPSMKTLGARTGCSESSVVRAIRDLKRSELVTVHQRVKADGGSDSNRYELDYDRIMQGGVTVTGGVNLTPGVMVTTERRTTTSSNYPRGIVRGSGGPLSDLTYPELVEQVGENFATLIRRHHEDR